LYAHPVDLLESKRLGRNEGLVIVFNTSFVDFPDSGKIFHYYMTDNRVQPTAIEINSFILFRDQEASVEIKKTVSRRLAYPHNNCQRREEGLVATDRTLIDKIADSDTDYLQETCFELCVKAHLSSVCNCTYYGVLRREDSYEESSDCNKVCFLNDKNFYYIYSDYLNINQIIQSNFINTNNFQLLIAAPDSD